MDNLFSVTTALCLAASDVEALIQGQMIAAISRSFISSSQNFALCPAPENSENVSIKAWATVEFCKILTSEEEAGHLSKATVWSNKSLQKILLERGKIFLVFLRVYRCNQSHVIPSDRVSSNKIGSFIRLSTSISASLSQPVLSSQLFKKRQCQLLSLEHSRHPELERLCSEITRLAESYPDAQVLENDLKAFLGWSDRLFNQNTGSHWVQTISSIGNSSDGCEFEKLVRKSLIELGFSNSINNSKASLDPEATGGAGGIDVYCNLPYSLIGECKASMHQTVPTDVCSQLTYLGQRWLEQGEYDRCIKIIFAAGKLTNPANNVAIGNKMNIVRPMTLQKLVELKCRHPGCINLLELKSYLESDPFGEDADQKLCLYVDRVRQRLKVRSNIVEATKKHLETTHTTDATADALHAAYCWSNPPERLDIEQFRHILFELTSPLIGCLGHRKDQDKGGSDRFYFLRDLLIEE